jgi:hypothetical protein
MVVLTGDKEELLDIADDYFVAASARTMKFWRIDHSGKLSCSIKWQNTLGDGTDPESVTNFMEDIDLLKE